MNDLELSIRLKADGSGLVGEVKISREEIEQLNKSLNAGKPAGEKMADGMDSAAKATDKARQATMTWHQFLKERMGPAMREFAAEGKTHAETHKLAIRQISREWKQYKATGVKANDAVNAAAGKTRKGIQSISEQLANAKKQFLAFFGVTAAFRGAKGLINMADDYQLLNSRLKLVTSSTEEFTRVQQQLLEVSTRSRVSLEGSTDIYTRMARSVRGMGYEQSQLLQVTETLNKTVTLSGVAADSARAALVQLGQGMASGTLRGDELRSVMEQIPRLAEALAIGMGKSIGELRKAGEAGEITVEKIIAALIKQSSVVDKEFGQMQVTVGQAMTEVTNQFTAYIGSGNEAHGITGKLAAGLLFLAKNMNVLADATTRLAVVTTAWFAAFKLATLAKTVALVSKLKGAVNLLGAAFAGFEIGTFLYEQFSVVRLVAITSIGQIINKWYEFKFVTMSIWEAVKAAFQGMINFFKESFSTFLNIVSYGLDKIGQKDAAAALRGTAAQLKPLTSAYEDAKVVIAGYRDEMEKSVKANNAVVLAMVNQELWGKKATAATNDLANANRNLDKAANELSITQQKLLDKLFPKQKRMRDYLSGLKELEKIQRKLGWSTEQHVKAVTRLAEETIGASKATEKLKKAVNPMAQIYKDTASSIRQSFRDTFRDMFDNGIDGFKGFAERMKNVFKDMLADMATLAIARPVIIPITNALGAFMGVPQVAQASVAQQLGGNATSAVGMNWLATGANGLTAGIGYAGAYLGSIGAGAGSQQASMLASQTAEFGPAGASATTDALGGIGPAGAGLGQVLGAGALGGVFGYAYSRGDNRATAAGAIGAGIGMALAGPLGAIVGGALGGSAFGSKTRTDRRGVDLDVAGTSVSGRQWEDKSRRRSFFRGTSRWREFSDLDGEIRSQIETTFSTIRESVYEFGTALDRDLVSRLNSFRTSYSGELKNLSDWISDVTEDMLRTALPGLEQFRRAGEETQAVVQRLSQTLGMMESLTTSIGSQLRLMRGESTPLDESARTIQSLWDKLGNTTDIQNRISLENDLYQQIMQRYQSEMSMIAQVTDALGTTLTNIEFGNQTPAQQLNALQSSFKSLLQQSQTLGGTELASVAQQLNQLALPLLNTAQQMYASGAGYQSAYDLITGGLGDVQQRLIASGNAKQDQAISNLEQISRLVNAERDKITNNSTGNTSINLRIVTPDGRELKQETLDDILRRSQAGEIVIDARGVASS